MYNLQQVIYLFLHLEKLPPSSDSTLLGQEQWVGWFLCNVTGRNFFQGFRCYYFFQQTTEIVSV